MTEDRGRMYASKNLPTARYIGCKCPTCKQDFTYDKGKSYDRHEYLAHIDEETLDCPVCNKTLKVPMDKHIFGWVEN